MMERPAGISLKEHEYRPQQRIVVTGMGLVSPLGIGVKENWKRLMNNESGITEMVTPVNSRVNLAGRVQNFDPLNYLSQKEARRSHRSAHFAVAASLEALDDAGFLDAENENLVNIDPERIGIRIGSGVGGSNYIAEVEGIIREKGESRIPPASIFIILLERVSTVLSIRVGIKGPTASTVAACATGQINITDSILRIRGGDADVMVTGGSESAIHRVAYGSFVQLGALSSTGSRPFDERADGFVMSEGAGILVIESLDHVIKAGRESRIKAEIVGYGDTADAYHESAPSGEGAERAIRIAIARAGIDAEKIDYINAHGTGTRVGDPLELTAIKNAIKDCSRLSVSSTKAQVGHLLGAAGGFESVVAIMSIVENEIPGTINLKNPIKEAEGLDLPRFSKKMPVNISGSGSFGFGGINSVILFKRYTPVTV